MDILPILNEVFAINPNGEDNKAFFNHGINWLWAVTAIHIVTFVRSRRHSVQVSPLTVSFS
jgi:hypothetical protein